MATIASGGGDRFDEIMVILRIMGEQVASIEEKLQKKFNHQSWYTTAQAAEVMELSSWTVRQMCNKKELAAERIEGPAGGRGEWRISHEEIERWRREGKRRPFGNNGHDDHRQRPNGW